MRFLSWWQQATTTKRRLRTQLISPHAGGILGFKEIDASPGYMKDAGLHWVKTAEKVVSKCRDISETGRTGLTRGFLACVLCAQCLFMYSSPFVCLGREIRHEARRGFTSGGRQGCTGIAGTGDMQGVVHIYLIGTCIEGFNKVSLAAWLQRWTRLLVCTEIPCTYQSSGRAYLHGKVAWGVGDTDWPNKLLRNAWRHCSLLKCTQSKQTKKEKEKENL